MNPRDACDHSSIIEHQQVDNGVWRKYSYLFWEASSMNGFSISVANASCVPSAELSNGLLQDALVAQGLSTDEATEMATHWLPDMTKKEFVLVEFLSREQIDDSMKLTVSPILLIQYTESSCCFVQLIRCILVTMDLLRLQRYRYLEKDVLSLNGVAWNATRCLMFNVWNRLYI